MNSEGGSCILLFVKLPAEGHVKTRLGAQLGEDTAAKLYESFVLDTLGLVNSLDAHLRICFSPAAAEDEFKQWLGTDYSYAPQTGRDLGQRMRNAFSQAFSDGFSEVVVIGSDIPDLPAEYLDQAFMVLGVNDVVVGPSSDGGYYLIGFSIDSFLPEAFDYISWSTADVLEQTTEILKGQGRRTRMLPQWNDIDTAEDLQLLIERNKNTAFSESATFFCLRHWASGKVYASWAISLACRGRSRKDLTLRATHVR